MRHSCVHFPISFGSYCNQRQTRTRGWKRNRAKVSHMATMVLSKRTWIMLVFQLRWRHKDGRTVPNELRHARTSTDPHHQTSMQIKSCLSQVRWFTGFAEDPPAFPTEWQARLGTALRHWWQTLPETEGDHHGEHICAGLDLICGITGVDVGHTRTDREPTVGGLTGHVDECDESRGDHVPVPRHGKGSIREASEGTPKQSCGSRAACKPTSSTEAPTSSTRLLLRAAETVLRGASRQVVALGA